MMNEKRVDISVIVPVFNVAEFVLPCLNSIKDQTFKNIDVIIINDGSHDGSAELCEEFARTDDRFTVIHQRNAGLSAARNTGIQHATGSYLAFIDGDDKIDPLMLETLYELCESSKSDIAVCGMGKEIDGRPVFKQPETISVKHFNTTEAMKELFKGELYRFAACNKLYKKELFSHVTFPTGMIHEDLQTTYKVIGQAERLAFTDYIGYIYVQRSNSILNKAYHENRLDSFKGWDNIIDYMNEKFPELKDIYMSCFAYWTADHTFYILNQVSNGATKRRYLRVIQSHVKKHYKQLMNVESLSIKYKYLLTMLRFNIALVNMNYQLKRALRKAS
ncbi:glycosyltransferase [Salipaludibacillus sp. LMS25]|jgi:glycosyltransferase involved in cell wall biosynthesis|uniref:glycosyltransferase family 2 protein n=1 Tax=Salipaludibacillus sp. LMS25 TaxID=2924031 RepID=UPI0020D18FFE|nr:glycosyltransferase [Salipaludibacillus sp. LMS25]UTR14871.1 glycosyltransferase [Salipaludibacillus sp. LMS25]